MGTSIDRTLSEEAGSPLLTRTGLALRLRPVTPDDGLALEDLFRRLTPEDLRFRFLIGLESVKPHQIASMLAVDHRQSEHLLAFDDATGSLAGSVMIVADTALETAEVAVVVAADYRGQGVGWTLLRHIAELARSRGIRRIQSVESRANHDAIEVERTLGFKARPYDGDSTLVLVEMTTN